MLHNGTLYHCDLCEYVMCMWCVIVRVRHPEKNNYEWTLNEKLPHSSIAVRASQYTANFFVDGLLLRFVLLLLCLDADLARVCAECRKSTHVFPEKDLQPLLIYNFPPLFSGATGSDFTQVYQW